jgi:hypothetical protein
MTLHEVMADEANLPLFSQWLKLGGGWPIRCLSFDTGMVVVRKKQMGEVFFYSTSLAEAPYCYRRPEQAEWDVRFSDASVLPLL